MFVYQIPLNEKICADIIVSCCSNVWTNSSLVVANAMAIAFKDNGTVLGDLALEERIKYLSQKEIIEIDNEKVPYGKYNVRLSRY